MSPRGVQTSVVKKSAPAISPQWACRNVRQEVGRSGAGRSPWALSTLATVTPGHAMAQVLRRPLDPRVAPRGIFGGHAQNEGRDLPHDPGTAWPLRREGQRPSAQVEM